MDIGDEGDALVRTMERTYLAGMSSSGILVGSQIGYSIVKYFCQRRPLLLLLLLLLDERAA